MRSTKPLRYAFDIGTNSIGWAAYRLSHHPDHRADPTVVELLGCGVRLFDDGRNPKDGKSLAEMRRVPRAARRGRDRFVLRRTTLLQQLISLSLLPRDRDERLRVAALDPYRIRAEGLDRRLDPHEIGRALMHINHRRGFQSNRRADRKAKPDEKGILSGGIARLREEISAAQARTFGELLWKRHGGANGSATPRTRQPVRVRLEGSGKEQQYRYYPERRMLSDEFDLLLTAQAKYHLSLLTENVVAELKETIFHQRPLKSPIVGKCTFVPSEPRLPKALPSVEARVIYETLNNLRFGEGLSLNNRLSPAHRDVYAQMLMRGQNITFNQMRTALKLPPGARFSLEDAGKSDLKDYVAKSAALAGKTKGKSLVEPWFGERWHTMPLIERDAILRALIETENEDEIVAGLTSKYSLSPEAARSIAAWAPPVGYARLGRTANDAILEELRAPDLPTYSEACRRAGWHHSDERTGEIELPLPYYGQALERHVIGGTGDPTQNDAMRYGRFPNPTAHVALNQLRRLVNGLVTAYGEPAQIVIELARELKLSEEQKDRERRKNRDNRAIKDRHRQILSENNQSESGENFLRLRLFEVQERAGGGIARCPFTLKAITLKQLFSSEVEIEHLLPYSRTLDDSAANKVVCFRDANRIKRAKTPHEAFHAVRDWTVTWSDIEAAAQLLPVNKRWRFGDDAMQRFEKEGRDFLARQLNETRHLSRMARIYLFRACDPDQVYVTTGQLTAMLRARWGLNSIWRDHNRAAPDEASVAGKTPKGRNDHRHHAVDAIVIGAVDRSLLNEMSRRAGQSEREDRERIAIEAAPEEPPLFPGFRDAARRAVDTIIVSLKPEHSKSGALHEDTAYGLVADEKEAAEIGNLVFRKPLVDLSPKEVDSIRDPHLRGEVQRVVAQFRDASGRVGKDTEKAFKAALAAFAAGTAPGREQGVRHVRIGKTEKGIITVRDRRTGAVYKAMVPGENHHMDIVQMRDDTWRGFGATMFDVNQKGWRPQWEVDRCGGKLVMRLHKGDFVELDDKDDPTKQRYMVVHSVRPSKPDVVLAEHNQAGKLEERHKSSEDTFEWQYVAVSSLKRRNARKVKVNEIGIVRRVRSNVE